MPKGGLRSTSWKPGQTGNPAGRNGATPSHVRELAREYTLEAIEKLVEIMRSSDAREAARAADLLLSRGWGRPAQEITLQGNREAPVTLVVDVKQLPALAPVIDVSGH